MNAWLKDDKGNRCSIEYFGSEEDAQKALDSLVDCKNCTNCSRCSDCSDCFWKSTKEFVLRNRQAIQRTSFGFLAKAKRGFALI
jgi:predicted neutral ceramidase superfamily lipid hydrolase